MVARFRFAVFGDHLNGVPIASLRALGSSSGNIAGAVANIIDYLEGRQKQALDLDGPDLVKYYADSQTPDSVGWWSGRGVNGVQLTGAVDPAVLAQVLLTKDPVSGEQLVQAAGSSGRATRRAVDDGELTLAQVAERLDVSKERVGQLAAAGRERDALLRSGESGESVTAWLSGRKQGKQWRFPVADVERHEATIQRPKIAVSTDGPLTVKQVAQLMDVNARRVTQLAAAGQRREELLAAGEDASNIKQWLSGTKDGKAWTFERSEVERAKAGRDEPRVVLAYDFTVSFEKSISLAWVQANAEQRIVIQDAIAAGVQAGLSHLEDHGLAVRRGRGAVDADGVWAASYLHLTNRNLEPQLHVHTVIANVAAGADDGRTQAIDARAMYRETTAAGYVAGAETRAVLTERLGASWDRLHKGTMEMAGVPDTAIAAMSTRRAEVMAIADELGFDTPKSRQVAALSTRAPKEHPEDFDDLVASLRDLVERHGYGPMEAALAIGEPVAATTPQIPQPVVATTPDMAQPMLVERVSTPMAHVLSPSNSGEGVEPQMPQPAVQHGVLPAETVLADNAATNTNAVIAAHRHGATPSLGVSGDAATSPLTRREYRGLADLEGAPTPVTGLNDVDTAALFAALGSAEGLTKSSGVFSRSDVVQAVVMWDAAHGGGARLRADAIQDVADRIVGGAGIGPRFTDHVVGLNVSGEVAQRSAGDAWLTTESMLGIEAAVLDAYRDGRGQVGGISSDHAAASIERWQSSTGHTLGADQAVMIREITSGSDRFALVVGPAGTGKTAALEVAARAWEDAGLIPVGLAVTGSAADTLKASTGMETSTVASILARDDAGIGSGLTSSTIVIVDEASMLSNRDHLRLVELVAAAQARMVAIGDPAQHGAVEAGGLWSHLVTSAGDQVSVLEVNRRQSGEHMVDVRLANEAIRNGEIKAAFVRLDAGDRIVTAPTSSELFDRLAADWYVDLLTHRAFFDSGPGVKSSSMMAENHSVRRELIERAQTLLRADGTLTSPGVKLGESTFHVGERVITRTQHDSLRFDDRTKLRNSTVGTVVDIHLDANGRHELSVAFDHKQTLRLDHSFLTKELRAGLHGGLVPEYAITTHVAQGQTMTAGRTVGTDASSREAIYVGLSRGTDDGRLYVVDRASLSTAEVPDVGLPVLEDSRTVTERLQASLSRTPLSEVATALDPNAIHVAATARRNPVPHPDGNGATRRIETAAMDLNATRAARRALVEPPTELVELIGPRPVATNPNRPGWDRAIAAIVSYQHRYLPGESVAATFDSSVAAVHNPDRYAVMRTLLDSATRTFAATQPTATLAEGRHTPAAPGARVAGDVLDLRAQLASTEPGPYVYAVLGVIGKSNSARNQWIRATESIETYRHRCGLTPTDTWPNATTARQMAIGPKPAPTDPMASRWEHASHAIDRTLAVKQTDNARAPKRDTTTRLTTSRPTTARTTTPTTVRPVKVTPAPIIEPPKPPVRTEPVRRIR
jgi:conjugative relaxase-like TrwC/TraI family protein